MPGRQTVHRVEAPSRQSAGWNRVRRRLFATLACVATLSAASTAQAQIVEIIDGSGDGSGSNVLRNPNDIALDDAGTVYVIGSVSNNAYKISPAGTITEIINRDSGGTNQGPNAPSSIDVAPDGDVYVAAQASNDVFEITPGGAISKIIDASGDGTNPLAAPQVVAVGPSGDVFVGGGTTSGASVARLFRIPPGGPPVEMLAGGLLDRPRAIAFDSQGNLFVAGVRGDNVLRVESPSTCSTSGTPCVVTEIIDGALLNSPSSLAIDADDNVFVASASNDSVFKIESPQACDTSTCVTTRIIRFQWRSHGLDPRRSGH